MSAIVCLVASPIAALTIWVLLRSPRVTRVVAAPRGDRWHEQATPTLGQAATSASTSIPVAEWREENSGADRSRRLSGQRLGSGLP